jgi:hypothetical protein
MNITMQGTEQLCTQWLSTGHEHARDAMQMDVY